MKIPILRQSFIHFLKPIFALVLAMGVFNGPSEAKAVEVFDYQHCEFIKLPDLREDRPGYHRPRRILKEPEIIDLMDLFREHCFMPPPKLLEKELDGETSVYLSPVDRLIYFGIPVNDPYFWIPLT